MLTLQLPEEIEARLHDAARSTGVEVDRLALEAILELLEDIEDLAAAEEAVKRIAAGEKTIPLATLVASYGLAD